MTMNTYFYKHQTPTHDSIRDNKYTFFSWNLQQNIHLIYKIGGKMLFFHAYIQKACTDAKYFTFYTN